MSKKKAFTIVELVVAMGLLVMLVGLSSMVFSTTVKAHRKATATIEITRNLRVLTEQLNADFRGLRKDAPLMFWFDSTVTAGGAEERFDMTHFLADGVLQTMKQYEYDADGNGTVDGSKTIAGNIARIFYGHANSVDLIANPTAVLDFKTYQVLSRKSHILTADSGILSVYGEIPRISNWPTVPNVIDYSQFDASFGLSTHITGTPPKTYTDENFLEFNTITLTNWINALNFLNAGNPDNADCFINECLDDDSRPFIDLTDFQTLHLLMAQGVIDFSIQWAYTVEDLTTSATGYVPIPVGSDYFAGVRWWPGIDPAVDGTAPGFDADNDFGVMAKTRFGAYIALPGHASNVDWYRVKPDSTETAGQMANQRCKAQAGYFRQDFYPKALKFTFRLKDSNNIFPDGKIFTHIVYLDN